jgi:hypothetical protein
MVLVADVVVCRSESCVPRESAESYCVVYSGTLAIYGNDLHASLAQTILEMLLQELPATISKLTSFGVTRVDVSKEFSKLAQKPAQVQGSALTKGARVGLVFCLLTIIAGIAVLVHFIRMEKERQQLSKNPRAVTLPVSGRWSLFRFYRHANDCDATQASSVSSGSNKSSATRRKRSHKKIRGISKEQKKSARNMEAGRPMLSVVFEDNEPDSIYIVDPDDDVYVCDSDGESFYGADPLASVVLD